MATSTTTTYNTTAQRLIDLSLTDVGAIGPGTTPDPTLRSHALDCLNLLIKELDDEGALLWHVSRRTQTLTSGTSNYTLTNDVCDIYGPARYTASGSTVGSQVTPMARNEFMSQPDRTLQGPVYRYYAEKALDATGIAQLTLYLFPVPPNTGDSLEYAGVLRSHDITDLSQTLDFPQRWISSMRWGLSMSIAPAYSADARVPFFTSRFGESKAKALLDDNERGPVQAVPFGTQYGYGYGPGSGKGAR